MTIRAIHLDLASDLSTDAFIIVLRRFHSHRGHVKIIGSDNSTNFIGTVTELKEFIKRIDLSKFVKYFSERKTDFQDCEKIIKSNYIRSNRYRRSVIYIFM